MALLFMDGFEMGDGTLKWDGATSYATSSASPRTSTNGGYYFHPSSSGDLTKYITASTRVTTGTAIRFNTFDSNDSIFSYSNSNGSTYPAVWVGINTNGYLEVRGWTGFFSTAILATGTTKLLTNTWYYLETQVTIDSSSGTVQVRLNGLSTPEINFTGNTMSSGSDANIYGIYSSVHADLDDFYILNDTGTANTTFLGDVRVYALKPNGNGTYSQLTGSDSDSVNNYQLVNEQPYNTTNYVGSATSGQRDTYTLEDVPANVTSVLGVQNNLIAAKSDAGTISMKPVMKIGGSLYYGATRSPNTAYGAYQDIYNTNPATSTSWTISDVNNLEDGMEVV